MTLSVTVSSAGLYLTGGLTPKNIDFIRGTKHGTENLFLASMLDKVRVTMAYLTPSTYPYML